MNSSNYVYGSKLSYLDYLQGQLYVEDIKKENRSLMMDMSRQTRQLIASNQALAERDIQTQEFDAEMIRDYLDAAADRQNETQEQVLAGIESGFERLTYSINDLYDSVADGMNAIGAKFQWCCSKIISSLGGMNGTLKELIRIAKTPTQTAAMEHFDIARDATRKGLYTEALEELNYAINGVPGVSAGYKLEWRLYQMMGVIKLGFIDCDMSLVNLAEAEQAFLNAAKYAECDYPVDAANAYLSAGWAAYCQGKLTTAVTHTEAALECNPDLGEAWYQLAKVNMALDNPEAVNQLIKALRQDLGYALKAASDGDFQKHEKELNECIRDFTQRIYLRLINNIRAHANDCTGGNPITDLEQQLETFTKDQTLLDYYSARDRAAELKLRLSAFHEDRLKNHNAIKHILAHIPGLDELRVKYKLDEARHLKQISKSSRKSTMLLEDSLHSPKTLILMKSLRDLEKSDSENTLSSYDECNRYYEQLLKEFYDYFVETRQGIIKHFSTMDANNTRQLKELRNTLQDLGRKYVNANYNIPSIIHDYEIMDMVISGNYVNDELESESLTALALKSLTFSVIFVIGTFIFSSKSHTSITGWLLVLSVGWFLISVLTFGFLFQHRKEKREQINNLVVLLGNLESLMRKNNDEEADLNEDLDYITGNLISRNILPKTTKTYENTHWSRGVK